MSNIENEPFKLWFDVSSFQNVAIKIYFIFAIKYCYYCNNIDENGPNSFII